MLEFPRVAAALMPLVASPRVLPQMKLGWFGHLQSGMQHACIWQRRRYSADASDFRRDGAVSVYVHWPFCKSKCTYCDFNRYIRDDVDHSRMRSCLLDELNWSLDVSGATR
jgi:coproporphyrinogen III oxidase-like Fe-S oxidoreductase